MSFFKPLQMRQTEAASLHPDKLRPVRIDFAPAVECDFTREKLPQGRALILQANGTGTLFAASPALLPAADVPDFVTPCLVAPSPRTGFNSGPVGKYDYLRRVRHYLMLGFEGMPRLSQDAEPPKELRDYYILLQKDGVLDPHKRSECARVIGDLDNSRDSFDALTQAYALASLGKAMAGSGLLDGTKSRVIDDLSCRIATQHHASPRDTQLIIRAAETVYGNQAPVLRTDILEDLHRSLEQFHHRPVPRAQSGASPL